MYIKNMTKDIYIKLIEYAVSKFNVFSLNKRDNAFGNIRNKCTDICKIIFSDSYFSENLVFNNYSEDLINKICEKYKDDERIHEVEFNYIKNIIINKYHQKIENIEEYMRLSIPFMIRYSIEKFMYDKNCEVFIKKYSKYKIENYEVKYKSDDFTTTYYFILNNESKSILLSKKDIYDWISPLNLEDLCIYKDGCMWLYSVAHEKMCDIACESREEYEYLKSMGVEFWQNEYVPNEYR